MRFNTQYPERWKKSLKITAVFIPSSFLFGFLIGTLGGVADPDGGWAAWRVGLLTGTIMAGIAAVLSFIGTAIHVGDGF